MLSVPLFFVEWHSSVVPLVPTYDVFRGNISFVFFVAQEGIPHKVDHGWVSTEFSTYGPIAYISLPKYPSTGDLKGFAFIEFETEEASQKCLDALGTKEFSSLHPFPKVGTNDMQRMQRALEKSG